MRAERVRNRDREGGRKRIVGGLETGSWWKRFFGRDWEVRIEYRGTGGPLVRGTEVSGVKMNVTH